MTTNEVPRFSYQCWHVWGSPIPHTFKYPTDKDKAEIAITWTCVKCFCPAIFDHEVRLPEGFETREMHPYPRDLPVPTYTYRNGKAVIDDRSYA